MACRTASKQARDCSAVHGSASAVRTQPAIYMFNAYNKPQFTLTADIKRPHSSVCTFVWRTKCYEAIKEIGKTFTGLSELWGRSERGWGWGGTFPELLQKSVKRPIFFLKLFRSRLVRSIMYSCIIAIYSTVFIHFSAQIGQPIKMNKSVPGIF